MADTLRKGDIIAHAVSIADIKEEAFKADPKLMDKAYVAFMAAIQDKVAKGNKVRITGFGSWELVHKPARTARNPNTGETVNVAETWKIRFKTSPNFEGLAKEAQQKKAAKP
ncbi:HU family DNA-binding protein [Streptosporangium lutulentum]|uniref:DNA-binding protein HU-beta n=1 Tax=Streptosporangium lutulentum TaxID=1461250 RepID=A0ABT9Q980_9ACTN|nr:HU family DNA-binding protein [Streptosporangium lutulentum]MDP9843312.1 DNA-binding protein HU-beta [Streptosporangium lutulentum]